MSDSNDEQIELCWECGSRPKIVSGVYGLIKLKCTGCPNEQEIMYPPNISMCVDDWNRMARSHKSTVELLGG